MNVIESAESTDRYSRLEMLVENDGKCLRWAHKLGFVPEFDKPCRSIMPDGSDGWMYVRGGVQ